MDGVLRQHPTSKQPLVCGTRQIMGDGSTDHRDGPEDGPSRRFDTQSFVSQRSRINWRKNLSPADRFAGGWCRGRPATAPPGPSGYRVADRRRGPDQWRGRQPRRLSASQTDLLRRSGCAIRDHRRLFLPGPVRKSLLRREQLRCLARQDPRNIRQLVLSSAPFHPVPFDHHLASCTSFF